MNKGTLCVCVSGFSRASHHASSGGLVMSVNAQNFYNTGMQYYTLGRYAVVASIHPVAGNILHQAIQMFLKGALARNVPAPARDNQAWLQGLEGSDRKLVELWTDFKKSFPDQQFERHDRVIALLGRFENVSDRSLRLGRGAMCTIGVKGGGMVSDDAWGKPEPHYDLLLEEIEDLAAAICGAAGVKPKFFTTVLKTAMQLFDDERALCSS